MRRRLESAGYEPQYIDHGYVQSLYVQDPDGLTVEFTAEPLDAALIAKRQRGGAHDTLARWLTGDHAPNNERSAATKRAEHQADGSSHIEDPKLRLR